MSEASPAWLISIVTGALGIFAGGGFAIWLGDRFWPENHPPIAVLEVAPDKGAAPLKSTLNGNASSDPDGQSLEATWFVDQTRLESREAVQRYEFPAPGTYTVTVEVRDPGGLVNRASKIVVATSAFDLQAHLTLEDAIRRAVEQGEFTFATQIARQGIENCSAAPPDRCAELHFQMGRSLIGDGDLPEARQTLEKANKLKPGDLGYAVTFAEVLIRLNEYQAAVDYLKEFNRDQPMVWTVRYYLALTQALDRDYGEAQTGLEVVSQNSLRYAHRAELGYVLASLLATPQGEPRPDYGGKVRKAICGEPALANLDAIGNGNDRSDVDLLSIKKLAYEHLNPADNAWLLQAMEGDQCP